MTGNVTQSPRAGDGAVPTVSVVIPTYNRRKWLGELLDSLAQQTLSFQQFEVLIVDDGSSDDTGEIVEKVYPFRHRYFYQTNQGDAAARNLGATQSEAEILVFLDDDIILEQHFLAELARTQRAHPNEIVVGTDILWLQETNPLAQETQMVNLQKETSTEEHISFADVCSNNMSVRRDVYVSVGMMENLGFRGSSIWCDVDFSYRAAQKGHEFIRSNQAVCWHRDHVYHSLKTQKERWHEAAYRAVVLFQKYPGLIQHIPMFEDKTSIAIRKDSPVLIFRKLFRGIVSSRVMIFVMEKMVSLFSDHPRLIGLSNTLQRWIVGGSIFHGYRKGLRDFGPIHVPAKKIVPAIPPRYFQ